MKSEQSKYRDSIEFQAVRRNDKIKVNSFSAFNSFLNFTEQSILNSTQTVSESCFEKKGNKSTTDSLMTPMNALCYLDKRPEQRIPLCINLTDMPYKLTLLVGHPLMDINDERFRASEGVHFIQSYMCKNTNIRLKVTRLCLKNQNISLARSSNTSLTK